MADLKFRVNAESANPTKTVVKARDFELIVDEPASLGGKDEGANPVEYLMAAYAGCLNVVAHLVAKEMNFELRGVKIDIEGNLNPAKFMGMSNAERSGFKGIVVNIEADASADAATLEQWKEAVCERCPVSDNIKNVTPVQIMVKQTSEAAIV